MNKPKTSWDVLKNMKPTDTTKYQDVYNNQQLERSHLKPPQTMKTRIIADIAMTIFFFFVFWLLASLWEYGQYLLNGGSTGASDFTDVEQIALSYGYFLRPTVSKVLLDVVFSTVFYGVMYVILYHNLQGQNVLSDMSELNQYTNDQHIALPEELQRKFDWFPDVGCTSDVQPSGMISHVMISNKGLKHVMMAKRADSDIIENGEIVLYKGDVLTDEDGNVLFEEKPIIDIPFAHALFDASGLPRDKTLRKFYNTTLIPYNPDGSDRDKLGKFDTVADLINKDWELPWYEPQRPGGAYLVDTAPVNTMVLAITRAGKGQTYIEPVIDMWTRERRANNMVINDPKGELLVKFYVRGTMRGFQIVQFNLINAAKTDIYNRAPRFVMKSCNVAC